LIFWFRFWSRLSFWLYRGRDTYCLSIMDMNRMLSEVAAPHPRLDRELDPLNHFLFIWIKHCLNQNSYSWHKHLHSGTHMIWRES
jgi:hypothetical protein